MATKRKSIIEDALLEAKTLEDALKANTKEILASHMKEEIETIVESSLKEQEDEEFDIDVVKQGSDDEPIEDAASEEEVVDDLEIALGDDESELDVIDLDIDLDADEEPLGLDVLADLGDADDIDLTGASDEEVVKVFKAMGDDDEVEVVKDVDGIYLSDAETGAEYYIKESEELSEDELCEGCGKSHVGDDDEDVMYEIELDEHGDPFPKKKRDPWSGNEDDYLRSTDAEGIRKRRGDVRGHYKGYEGPYGENFDDESITHPGRRDYVEEEETIEEDLTQNNEQSGPYNGGRQRYGGQKAGTSYATGKKRGRRESRNQRKTISNKRKTPSNIENVSNSKIVKEYKELKTKNEEYKEALKLFKGKLNEVALFNTNLAYVNRLFTEHSTTKKEKMTILKRFDNAESVNNSKSIYKTIKSELEEKTPITESVENKVNRTVKSSASDLNESTAYVDPQIVAIKDLMKRIS
jgi:hypothetical protein